MQGAANLACARRQARARPWARMPLSPHAVRGAPAAQAARASGRRSGGARCFAGSRGAARRAPVVRAASAGRRGRGCALCSPGVAPPVGQQARGAAHAEEAVGDEHGALVAKVPVLRDVLGGDHQRARARVPLRGAAGASAPHALAAGGLGGACLTRGSPVHKTVRLLSWRLCIRGCCPFRDQPGSAKRHCSQARQRRMLLPDPAVSHAEPARPAGPRPAGGRLRPRARARACSSSCARPMAISPALQPMPLRLYVMTLGRMRKWFTTMDASDGVGLNSEQFTIRMSTCARARRSAASHAPPPGNGAPDGARAHMASSLSALRSTPTRLDSKARSFRSSARAQKPGQRRRRACRAATSQAASTWRTDSNMTISASARAIAMVGHGGRACTAAPAAPSVSASSWQAPALWHRAGPPEPRAAAGACTAARGAGVPTQAGLRQRRPAGQARGRLSRGAARVLDPRGPWARTVRQVGLVAQAALGHHLLLEGNAGGREALRAARRPAAVSAAPPWPRGQQVCDALLPGGGAQAHGAQLAGPAPPSDARSG